jgi:hypothetical protein
VPGDAVLVDGAVEVLAVHEGVVAFAQQGRIVQVAATGERSGCCG